MIKRLRDFARKDDAVIEVFSEILLTGIIVIAIAAAAAFVLSSLDEPDNVRVDIDHWADSDSDTLYFRHSGGETVDIEDLELVVYINGSYEKLTSSQFNYDDDEWALGDVIEVNTSSQFNYDITDDTRVPTKLVHTASSLVIYDAYGSMGDSGAGNGEQQSPTADFSYSPANPIPGETVDFTDQSSDPDGTIDEWSWNFGDGNTSTAQNPSHQYSSEGTYTVTLTVTDNDGNTDSISNQVTVNNTGLPIIQMRIDDLTHKDTDKPEYIVSYDISNTNSSFKEVRINFENQNDSSASADSTKNGYRGNFTYIKNYGATDNYNITFEIIYENGVEYVVNQSTVLDVADAINPSGNLNLSIIGSPSFNSVLITDETNVEIDKPKFSISYDISEPSNFSKVEAYAISLGSGGKASKEKASTTGVINLNPGYGANTDFKVVALVYDNYGAVVDSYSIIDNADGSTLPTGPLTAPELSNPNPASPYTSTVQDDVTFSATSNQSSNNEFLLNGTRVAWSNGTSPSYTNTTPSVGTYNLTLIARNQTDPSLTDSISWIWTVEASNESPVAEFSYSPLSPETGQTITFDASASYDPDGSITSYEWNWTNDGTYYSTTSAIATHSYSSPGSYNVKLGVTDDDGNTNNTTQNVNVVGLLYNNDAIAKDGPDTPSPDKAGGVEFSIQNFYGSNVTIDSIKIDPDNDNIAKLSDDIAPNNKKEYVEVYAESDIDGYSDYYGGVSIPPEGLEVAIGQDGDETSGVIPQVNSSNVMTFYVYEFYEEAGQSGNFKNINMKGEDVEITINYTVEGDQKSKTFTITPQ